VGPAEAYLVGVYSGTLYVDDGKGSLHAASIVCPATAEGDLKKMTRTGQGRCILTDEEGNRVYARFTCTGDMESCRGPFKIVGGTGKFTGITGEGEMISRLQVEQSTRVIGFDTAEQQGEGVAIWPSLSYKVPSSPNESDQNRSHSAQDYRRKLKCVYPLPEDLLHSWRSLSFQTELRPRCLSFPKR